MIALPARDSVARLGVVGTLRFSGRNTYLWCGRALPWAVRAGLFFFLVGIGYAAMLPAERIQAEFKMIALLHVPLSWLAVLLCISMAFWAALGIVLERPLAFLLAQASAPTGGMFAFLALVSGGAWSRALGGPWWTGEIRQVAELVLLIWYLAIVGIPVFVDRHRIADRLAALIAVIAMASVSVLYFLGQWIESGSRSVGRGFGGVGAVNDVLLPPIGLCALGLWFYATVVIAMRYRCSLLQRYTTVGPERGTN